MNYADKSLSMKQLWNKLNSNKYPTESKGSSSTLRMFDDIYKVIEHFTTSWYFCFWNGPFLRMINRFNPCPRPLRSIKVDVRQLSAIKTYHCFFTLILVAALLVLLLLIFLFFLFLLLLLLLLFSEKPPPIFSASRFVARLHIPAIERRRVKRCSHGAIEMESIHRGSTGGKQIW